MMSAKPTHNGRPQKNGTPPVSRAEFEEVVERLRERDEIINELRRDVQATCRDLSEDVRRQLQTQFTRIAQIQQELDAVKRRA